MFVDASAIVAILTREAGFETLADRLRSSARPLTSGIAVYEAVLAVARKRCLFSEAEAMIWAYGSVSRIEVVPVSDRETRSAPRAFAGYGKGQGHPAQLNPGDCFAYACARRHDAPLLFVANDFAQTDIRSAMA